MSIKHITSAGGFKTKASEDAIDELQAEKFLMVGSPPTFEAEIQIVCAGLPTADCVHDGKMIPESNVQMQVLPGNDGVAGQ